MWCGTVFSWHVVWYGILMSYSTTPHATTNVAQCVLFLGHTIYTKSHLLSSDPATDVANYQAK